MQLTLSGDLFIHDIGFKHTFTGDGFMVEFNTIKIKEGYAWNARNFVHGGVSNDGRPINWVASCVHTCLYNKKNPLKRSDADYLFYRESVKAGLKRAWIYYFAFRLFGWLSYNGKMK